VAADREGCKDRRFHYHKRTCVVEEEGRRVGGIFRVAAGIEVLNRISHAAGNGAANTQKSNL
jgi:hypothetical protein